MKWLEKLERLWRTPARKYLLIGILIASGVGTPLAVGIGTGIDQAATEIEAAEHGEKTQE
jgi:hypothetical protein